MAYTLSVKSGKERPAEAEGSKHCDKDRLKFETDKRKAPTHYQESVDMGDDNGINNLEQCDKKRSEICDENDKYKEAALEGLRKACTCLYNLRSPNSGLPAEFLEFLEFKEITGV
ncbi:hypothetical protein C2G38_2037205 [Gigaspora rosea]|uniref:Uncharacterized protein n=1 Tax=Gigaspora rosea TaxID=44941 RepID=A0A397V693_9GLOM|nr:hypothetical protein C2G38_2037205 [Gigaspora rosea]